MVCLFSVIYVAVCTVVDAGKLTSLDENPSTIAMFLHAVLETSEVI